MATDPLKDYPGYALRRVSAAGMAALARRLEALDLRPAEATVLMVIEANPRITQSEVGRLLDIASPNMAPLASRLQARGLIVRERVDGRSQALRLSDTGRKLAARARKAMVEHEARLLAPLGEAQRKSFLSALRLLRADPTDQ
jgi:DNA-binding MarR family transcriptional regulator